MSYAWAPAFLLSHFCKGYLPQPPSLPPAQTCTVNKSGSGKWHFHQRPIFWKAQSQHHICTSVRPAAGCKFLITDGWAWLQSPTNYSLSSYWFVYFIVHLYVSKTKAHFYVILSMVLKCISEFHRFSGRRSVILPEGKKIQIFLKVMFTMFERICYWFAKWTDRRSATMKHNWAFFGYWILWNNLQKPFTINLKKTVTAVHSIRILASTGSCLHIQAKKSLTTESLQNLFWKLLSLTKTNKSQNSILYCSISSQKEPAHKD